MKGYYIIASLAVKWCRHFGIGQGEFYQHFLSLTQSLRRFSKSEVTFLMYKRRKNGDKTSLFGEFADLSNESDVVSIFLSRLVAFSVQEHGNFEVVFDVFKAFHSKIESKKIFIKLLNQADDEFINSLKYSVAQEYSGKAMVEVLIDDKLIDGWIIFNDFFKIDYSLAGRVDAVFDRLQV